MSLYVNLSSSRNNSSFYYANEDDHCKSNCPPFCLICGSQSPDLQSFSNGLGISGDNCQSLSNPFCKLYGIIIQSHRSDIQDIFQNSLFCSQCRQELNHVDSLYSHIEALKIEIQGMKVCWDAKLKDFNSTATHKKIIEGGQNFNGHNDSIDKLSAEDVTRQIRSKLYNYAFYSTSTTTTNSIENFPGPAPVYSAEPAAWSPIIELGESSNAYDNTSPNCQASQDSTEQLYYNEIDTSSPCYDFPETTDFDCDLDPLQTDPKASILNNNLNHNSHKLPSAEPSKEVILVNLVENFTELRKKYNLKELSIRVEKLEHSAAATKGRIVAVKRKSASVPVKIKTVLKLTGPKNRPFICTHVGCFRSFSTELERTGHTRYVHEGISHPYTCETCSRNFVTYRAFKDHENNHKGLRPFKCSQCDKSYAVDSRLKRHIKLIHDSKEFCCDKCGEKFAVNHLLETHMHFHVAHKPFSCDICGKSFRLAQSLKNHQFTHPELNLKGTQCRYCDRVLVGRYYLKLHERKHTGEKLLRCHLCDFGTPLTSVLNRHLLTHSDTKNFECDVCKHAFKSLTILKRHKNQYHPATKDFICSVCGKVFSCKRYLDIHEEIHKEIKRLLCTLCGKTFAQHSSYYYHMRHTHKVDKSKCSDT